MIIIVIYLFATIKQTQVVCENVKVFDSDIKLEERIVAMLDGKSIRELNVTKTITLPDKFSRDDTYLNSIKYSLENTLEYLGNDVKYVIDGNKLIVKINVSKDEIILLDNIDFIDNGDLEVEINSNTKSSDIITLKVGDNYTDSELMKKMKNNGYSCK